MSERDDKPKREEEKRPDKSGNDASSLADREPHRFGMAVNRKETPFGPPATNEEIFQVPPQAAPPGDEDEPTPSERAGEPPPSADQERAGAAGDALARTFPPGVPHTPDEGAASSTKILLNGNAEKYLDHESLFTLIRGLIEMFERLAEKHRSTPAAL